MPGAAAGRAGAFEPPPERVGAELLTPQRDLFVRHCVPPVSGGPGWRLRVGGLQLAAEELRSRFRSATVEATLQCAENRRGEMHDFRPTTVGPHEPLWGTGAIGHGRWTGALLSDVLAAAAVLPRSRAEAAGLHVVLCAADGYSVSVPLALALSRRAVLAWAMNGEQLTPEHGAPLRAVIPGVTGARWVKALASVSVSSKESSSVWQHERFRMQGPGQQAAQSPAVYDMPTQCAMVSPLPNAELPRGARTVTCRGYAYGGSAVARVDVSADGGMTWQQAALTRGPSEWSWVLWEAELPLQALADPAVAQHMICCKVVSSSGDSQPETARSTWNPLGLLHNAWHCVPLTPHPADAPSSGEQSLYSGDLAPAAEDAEGGEMGELPAHALPSAEAAAEWHGAPLLAAAVGEGAEGKRRRRQEAGFPLAKY